MRALLLPIPLVTCGTGPRPGSLPAANQVSCAKDAPALPAKLAGAQWCFPIRAGTARRWFFRGSTYELFTDATGGVLYRADAEWLPEATTPQVLDLDHDGNDELLYVSRGSDDHSGISLTRLEIYSFEDPRQPTADNVQLASDAAGVRCKATFKLIDREGGGKDIEVTGDCEKDVVHPEVTTVVYRWKGRTLERQ